MRISKKLILLPISVLALSGCGKDNTKYFTVTWKNYDGTVLEVDKKVKEGDLPSYDSPTPKKEMSNTEVFTFKSWDKKLTKVVKNVTYTATFSSETRYYNVKFMNGETELSNENYEYGAEIDTSELNPTKDSTPDTAYEFTGWDKEVVAVTEDNTVYNAVFKEIHVTLELVDDSYYKVTGLMDPDYEGPIHIPATWGGKPIKSIGSGAFKNKNVTALTFDEDSNITEIAYQAFYSCSKLASAHIIGDGMTIDQYAFGSCRYMLELTLEGVKQINGYAFNACGVQELTLPASLDENEGTAVRDYAFQQCFNLYAVTLDCHTAKIASYAFSVCGSITEVISNVGDVSTSKLGTYYIWLNNEEDIQSKRGEFTKDEPTIETGYLGRVYYKPYNYSQRKYLVSSFGPGNILHTGTADEVKESAFYGNIWFKYLIIGTDITRINRLAFDGCTSCTSVVFQTGGENALEAIGQAAFRDVNHTGKLILPARAKNCNLDQYAFTQMPRVTAFEFEDNASDYNSCVDGVLFTNHQKTLFVYPQDKPDTSYIVPASVTYVNDYVGIRNNNLEELHFASTTTLALSSYVISGTSLESVSFEDSVQLTLSWYVFTNTPKLRTLVLPANTIARGRAFGNLGTSEQTSCNVFFSGTNIDGWAVSSAGNGPWYDNKGSYCNIYLYSEDAKVAAEDLPEHFAGSWHYVGTVVTIWE